MLLILPLIVIFDTTLMVRLTLVITAVFFAISALPIFLWLLRLIGFYTIVHERRYHVYVLFGKVIGVLEEPGFYLLWFKLGWKALFVGLLGRLAD